MYGIPRSIRAGTSDVRLLFVTPEKVAKSDAMVRMLDALVAVGRLDRCVVDEVRAAVCVGAGGRRKEGGGAQRAALGGGEETNGSSNKLSSTMACAHDLVLTEH